MIRWGGEARCEELILLKKPWCWGRLKVGGERDNRGWDGWTASPTQWTWVWVNSRSWWWTGRPGVLQSMGSQRIRHDWTELTEVVRHGFHKSQKVSRVSGSADLFHRQVTKTGHVCVTLSVDTYTNLCPELGKEEVSWSREYLKCPFCCYANHWKNVPIKMILT